MAKSQKTGRKSFTRLNIHERSIIEIRYCIDKKSVRSIAQELGRSHSTVLREINGRPRKGVGRYKAVRKQQEATERIKQRGRKKQLDHPPLWRYMREKLTLGWSPEQVSIRLPVDYPRDTRMRVSHETIYAYIYGQEGSIDLRHLLPRKRKRRVKKGVRKTQKLERLHALPSIEDRPKEAQRRVTIGHWEGDTVLSHKGRVRIKSMNELTSGVTFFAKTKDGTAQACNHTVIKRMQDIPTAHRLTLLQDRGSENREWQYLEQTLGISCYFAHPYCSHERGSNENTNGLLRRYFPKGTDFGKITAEKIAKVEYLLNTRPRKRLNGLTPYEVFYSKTGVDLKPVAYSRMTSGALET